MTQEQREKTRFRASARWKKFKSFMKKNCQSFDIVTGKKLLKGWNLHHMDLNVENYEKLTPEHFVCLNKKTHDFVHWCFTYYRKDKDFLKRLESILEQMKELND